MIFDFKEYRDLEISVGGHLPCEYLCTICTSLKSTDPIGVTSYGALWYVPPGACAFTPI